MGLIGPMPKRQPSSTCALRPPGSEERCIQGPFASVGWLGPKVRFVRTADLGVLRSEWPLPALSAKCCAREPWDSEAATNSWKVRIAAIWLTCA